MCTNQNKPIDAVSNVLKSITNQKPIMIISDSNSTLTSQHSEELLNKKHINHNIVPVGDHHILGVIEQILTKRCEITKSANWTDMLDKVISMYNKSGHCSLDILSHNQAVQNSNK